MKRRILLAFFACFLAVWSFAQADLQPAAIVNLTRTEPITVRQLRTEVERFERGVGRPLNERERREVLDVMINERLAVQAAERDRVSITENELNQQMNQLRAQMAQQLGRQPTDAEFAEAIRNESGLEMPAFREQMRRQLLVQKYLVTQKQDSIESNIRIPTEQEIQREFNLARSDFVRPETVRISVIQVPYGPDAASRTRARTQIDGLLREIGTSSARFNEVITRSQAPNSGFMGGDFGFVPRNREAMQTIGEVFFNTAFNLRQGEISGVIEGPLGFQIMMITETFAMRNLELDDIFQLGTRVTVRDFIGNTLLQRRQMEALNQASQELVAELRAGRTFQIFERNLSW